MTNVSDIYFTNVWILMFMFGTCSTLVSLIVVCICGCRKEAQKNDLLGVDGMVKITNPDENVNHIPAAGKYVSQDLAVIESDDSSKRLKKSGVHITWSQITGNPHRSLPDIPHYADGEVRNCSDNGALGDTSSELYATVDDKTTKILIESESTRKRHTFSNGIDSVASLSQHSSISQTDNNYACVKENPYDKVKKTENPYAKVQPAECKEDENFQDHSRRINTLCRNEEISHTSNECATNSAIVSVHSASQTLLTVSSNVGNSSTPDIPAATAVAGRIPANQELPYMTPPLQQSQHFSGDSQDSSKGYTSISVREPLSNIIKQTAFSQSKRSDLDPHYSTVSDDSDEMYAAIVEPHNQIYTSGSETYAQIQPITVAEIHSHPPVQDVEPLNDQYEPPQPPSVDSLKHVAHVHSRQASSSSCTSLVANLGSPKPEKRQANSPLPPPPSISPDLYARVDKINEREDVGTDVSIVKNLEDMYARVHKSKKKHEDEEKFTKSLVQSAVEISTVPLQKLNMNIKKIAKESNEESKSIDSVSIYSSDSDTSDFKNFITRKPQEHCYETLNKDKQVFEETEFDVGYERIRDACMRSSEPVSLLSNDPGYEQVNHLHHHSLDIDPNYEELHPKRSLHLSDQKPNMYSASVPDKPSVSNKLIEDGYSVVNKIKKSKFEPGYEELRTRNMDEPNYESVPNESINVSYSVSQQTSSETESDPNYESVKYLHMSTSEPPYERLNNDEMKEYINSESELEMANKDLTSGYDSIKRKISCNSENTTSHCNISNSNTESSIEVPQSIEVEEALGDEELYFQV